MIQCRYGDPGHYNEWVILIEGFHHGKYIPRVISDDLQIRLPDAAVLNRGNRVEIMTDDDSEEMKRRIFRTIEDTFVAHPYLEEERTRELGSTAAAHKAWRAQIEHDKRHNVQLPLDWKPENED